MYYVSSTSPSLRYLDMLRNYSWLHVPQCYIDFRRRRGEGKKTSTATAPDEPDTPGVEFKVPPFGESMGDFFSPEI